MLTLTQINGQPFRMQVWPRQDEHYTLCDADAIGIAISEIIGSKHRGHDRAEFVARSGWVVVRTDDAALAVCHEALSDPDVARRLAEVLGGGLAGEDTPGGGATFVLSVPMKVSSDAL